MHSESHVRLSMAKPVESKLLPLALSWKLRPEKERKKQQLRSRAQCCTIAVRALGNPELLASQLHVSPRLFAGCRHVHNVLRGRDGTQTDDTHRSKRIYGVYDESPAKTSHGEPPRQAGRAELRGWDDVGMGQNLVG